jgi:hypothetical protein
MRDIPSFPIGDFENEIPISFPGEETSLDRGDFPHISFQEISHARMEPSIRFSPPHKWKTQKGLDFTCHHGFEDAYEHTKELDKKP